ncbi:MAG: enoyl-CoA hydratase-related protein [candidate division WOR-3 bacterium]
MKKDDLLVKREEKVIYLTINGEKRLNVLNRSILGKLGSVFDDIEKDDELRIAVITGAGSKAFAAGADVREIKNAGTQRTALIKEGQDVLKKIMYSSKVTIAAINGYALGGGLELAMACDIRIAVKNAKLGLPEVTLGVMPGYGGTQLLPRLVGWGMAKYLLLTGLTLTADQAYRIGLVQKVCRKEKLRDEVEKIVQRLLKVGPLALKGCKEAINKGLDVPLHEALDLESKIYDRVAKSRDAEEGLTSFLEKRTPRFRGV